MNKEQWADKIMSSTQGMSRAVPGGHFYEQVQQKLHSRPAKTVPLPLKQWAAAAILLLALNAGSVAWYIEHSGSKHTAGNSPFAAAMLPEPTYNY